MSRITALLAALLSPFVFGCVAHRSLNARATVQAAATSVDLANLRAMVNALADDSMTGRRTGTQGARRAAIYIAERMQRMGLTPAGDSGFFQRVPLGLRDRIVGPPSIFGLDEWARYDGLAPDKRLTDANVAGLIRGADPILRESAIVVGAHYDHLGITYDVSGDTVFNGADDDASGVATVLEIARILSAQPPLKRTVVFLLTTGEEIGLFGIKWYVRHPVVPLERTVANLQIEMTGRPDSLAGGSGYAWLTGDDRSTMGAILRQAKLHVVPDPRPAQRFFERSDNIVFAQAGIPAHTLSSFNLHNDYHQVTDHSDRIDIVHFARVAETALAAVRVLADGPAPMWMPGGKP